MRTYLGVVATAAGMLAACGSYEHAMPVIDDNSLRIEESMRPDTQPPPEGISLGLDAPPLAPPERDVLYAPVYSFPERMSQAGTNSPWYYSGPYPYPLLMPTPTPSCPPAAPPPAPPPPAEPENDIQPPPGPASTL